jgi:hypothetical protein
MVRRTDASCSALSSRPSPELRPRGAGLIADQPPATNRSIALRTVG